MKTSDTITVAVPRAALVAALLERLGAPDANAMPPVQEAIAALPAIGAEYRGGLYAGTTLHQGRPHELVLMPGQITDADWAKARAWASEQEADLPSRIDMLVLFANLKPEFEDAAYWTNAPYERDSGSAWGQTFDLGLQYYWTPDFKLRARAVRRFSIE